MKKWIAFVLVAAALASAALLQDMAYAGKNSKTKVTALTVNSGEQTVTKKTVSMEAGTKKTLSVTTKPRAAAKAASYRSSSPSVVSVDQNGGLTASKEGTAKITVTVSSKKYKKKTAWVKIRVSKADGQKTDGSGQADTGTGAGGLDANEPQRQPDPVDKENNDGGAKGVRNIAQRGWTESVPPKYLAAASEKGSVAEIAYGTKDYAGNGGEITKTAYVYLPYGYDGDDTKARYNILYLMHGWGGHAGEYFEFGTQKNVFDNLIEKGDIPPLIIVSASFYNENTGWDFGDSVAALREFHHEFENDLMPAVEGKYRTFAASSAKEDLMASRNHRAFGGFSLGSVTTWLQFCYDYDYIRFYLPMSGSCWYYGTYGDFQIGRNVDFIEQLVKEQELDERGYFIYHAVGTNDTVKSQSIDMAQEMLSRELFTADHYVFYQKDGGYHDFDAVQEYLYNALPLFFRAE